jgi:hypothetical protein
MSIERNTVDRSSLNPAAYLPFELRLVATQWELRGRVSGKKWPSACLIALLR